MRAGPECLACGVGLMLVALVLLAIIARLLYLVVNRR